MKLLTSIDSPFIVAFYETFEDEKNYYIVEELVEYGNLLQHINKSSFLSVAFAKHTTTQLCLAVGCFMKKMFCRDIKAENILIDGCSILD